MPSRFVIFARSDLPRLRLSTLVWATCSNKSVVCSLIQLFRFSVTPRWNQQPCPRTSDAWARHSNEPFLFGKFVSGCAFAVHTSQAVRNHPPWNPSSSNSQAAQATSPVSNHWSLFFSERRSLPYFSLPSGNPNPTLNRRQSPACSGRSTKISAICRRR